MKRKRTHYSAEQKVAILRRHLVEGTAVSDLCDEFDLHPNVFYRWQREFFEGGAAAFAKDSNREVDGLKREVATLREKLSRKNDVLAEVLEELVVSKKNGGTR